MYFPHSFTKDIYSSIMKTGSDLSEYELTSLSLALDFITLARVDANVVLYGSFGFW